MRVEQLAAAVLTGHAVNRETSVWVAELDDALHSKLAQTGLVDERGTLALKGFVDIYIAVRSDVKQSTATFWRRTRKHLLAFFGEDRLLRDITPGEAKDFRRYLLSEKPRKRPLAEDTIRRTCGIAKQLFEDAVERRMFVRNPFKHRDIPTATGVGDKSREFVVSRELAKDVLDILPDTLVADDVCLGPLRRSPLTLRRAFPAVGGCRLGTQPHRDHQPQNRASRRGESRVIPLFPELRAELDQCYELAAAGEEYVITRYRKMDSNYGVLLGKLVERAGLEMWPKPFQNLRSTRETELAEEFPMHVVCAWIGNSQLVAAKHCLQVTDDHFASALHNPVQQAHETPSNGPQGDRRARRFAGMCGVLRQHAGRADGRYRT